MTINKMKHFPFLFILLIPVLSCREDDPAKLEVCGVKDPVRNLPWLKDLVEKTATGLEAKYSSITLVYLRDEPVFNYSSATMSCIGCVNYHCDGTRVDMKLYTEAERVAFKDNLFNKRGKRVVVWPGDLHFHLRFAHYLVKNQPWLLSPLTYLV